ncbi:MAG TPA: hypothetical protein VH639_07845 [Bryobacteraceae bacterium]
MRILVVSSPPLSRLIKHLFEGRPDFEVTTARGGLKRLAPRIERFGPKLIVADVKPVGTNVLQTVRAVKRSSPLSKLILICPLSTFAGRARQCGADACLEPDELVRRLLPAAAMLSFGPAAAISKQTAR